MKCILFLFIILGPVINLNGQSNSMFDIEYQVRFNDAFDRGRKDRMHKGHLLINENLTRFYMTAVEAQKYGLIDEVIEGTKK